LSRKNSRIISFNQGLKKIMKVKRPIILLILDGWGLGEDDAHNAIFLAKTPNIDYLLANYPNGPIGAAGTHIGLTPGHQGSTEMGHLIMGAGRNVLLPQIQIKQAIATNAVLTNKAYTEAVLKVKKNKSRLHLMGLLSDAGVHSYDALAHKLLTLAAKEGLKKEQVLIHVFSDGRDTPPESLPIYIKRLQSAIKKNKVGLIVSVQGRYFVMDRDHRWERVQQAYDLLAHGQGQRTAKNIEEAIRLARQNQESDEFIKPTLIEPEGYFKNNDAVINFNYRIDREIEITQALIEPDFSNFVRKKQIKIHYVATMPYYDQMPAPTAFTRSETEMKNILGAVLSARGYTQYRVTETEKWVFVTQVFNGMRVKPFLGEDRHLIPSDKIATFDLKPEMQAVPIAQDLVKQLAQKKYDFYVANICNADMLGHTGNKAATIKGCETIDKAVGLLYQAVQKQNAILLICADHGDAEVMWDYKNNTAHTQHTDNFVPFILVDKEKKNVKIWESGSLKDIAPTILELMGVNIPEEMDGQSLIIKK